MRDNGKRLYTACIQLGLREQDRPTASVSYAGNEKKKIDKKSWMLTQESETQIPKEREEKKDLFVVLSGLVCSAEPFRRER